MLPEEVALSRFPVTGWSPETTIDLEMRKTIIEIETDRAVEEAENPPPPPPTLPPPGGNTGHEEDENTGHLEDDGEA